jgi:glutaredoxin
MKAILFTAPNCPKCELAKKKIAAAKADVQVMDGTTAEGYAERAWRELIHIQSAPVLYLEDEGVAITDINAIVAKIGELGKDAK